VDLKDYDYEFPESLVALTPLENRSDSRLLVYRRHTQSLGFSRVAQICDSLPAKTVLVFNESPVFPARFHARRESGAALEGLFLEAQGSLSRVWLQGRVSAGERIIFKNNQAIRIQKREDREALLEWEPAEFRAFLREHGLPGLPPYIRNLRKKIWGFAFCFKIYRGPVFFLHCF
jgi:S-adenosylmethionine:tRNA ribosyltransferase-isomerase